MLRIREEESDGTEKETNSARRETASHQAEFRRRQRKKLAAAR
jgi:hypothetical protein